MQKCFQHIREVMPTTGSRSAHLRSKWHYNRTVALRHAAMRHAAQNAKMASRAASPAVRLQACKRHFNNRTYIPIATSGISLLPQSGIRHGLKPSAYRVVKRQPARWRDEPSEMQKVPKRQPNKLHTTSVYSSLLSYTEKG